MIYLYLSDHRVKVISLNKSLLGQYHFSFFEKYHDNHLLENGLVKNVDLVASAIKEALTLAKPQEIKEKEVFLILSQSSFVFARYEVPPDISESAIIPFIRNKSRVDFPIPIDELFYNYLLVNGEKETKVLFFGQEKKMIHDLEEIFGLLDLTLKAVIPETLTYFELFNKTLKKGKKENILYVNYENQDSFGYLYDSYNLLKPQRYLFKKDLEKELRNAIRELNKNNIPVDRVILSGKNSEKIRQDFFTKNVGAWTNPLKRILTNFYGDFLKYFIIANQSNFSFLDFDVCLGGFIFHQKNKSFSIISKKPQSQRIVDKKPLISPPLKTITGDLFIFFATFIITFFSIFFFIKIRPNLILKNDSLINIIKPISPTPTPLIPTITPTPTLSIKKEDLKIKVLNGSGTPGKASEVKNILKNKGYNDILVGNADNFNYQTTEIQIKKDYQPFFNQIKNELADFVNLKKESSLSAETSADIILIIGKDFK